MGSALEKYKPTLESVVELKEMPQSPTMNEINQTKELKRIDDTNVFTNFTKPKSEIVQSEIPLPSETIYENQPSAKDQQHYKTENYKTRKSDSSFRSVKIGKPVTVQWESEIVQKIEVLLRENSEK